MKLKPVKLAPALIAVGVIILVSLLRLLHPDILERPELMTYDMRVREALKFEPPALTNIGFVYISDNTIEEISKGLLGRPFGLYWPRQIYGRLIRELSAQKAKAVGLDVVFSERRPDHAPAIVPVDRWPDAMGFALSLHGGEPPVTYEDQGEKLMLMESDEYFAWQLHRANNVILAADKGVRPNRLFASNAVATADISATRDTDGVLRRAKAFQIYTNWHPLFLQVENDPNYAVDLQKARIDGTNIVLPRMAGLDPIRVPVDADNDFELSAFLGDHLPPGWPKKDKAFTTERVWHIGIVLAAQQLGLDLRNAGVNLAQGLITLRGSNGVQRTFSVDDDGYFYINWEIPYSDPHVTKEPMEDLLKQDMARYAGTTNGLLNRWENKLAVVGSKTVGNDLTDRGATPLEKDTLLVSEHWNVANAIMNNRMVRRSSLPVDLLLITLLGVAAALLTWQLRALLAFLSVMLLAVGYVVIGNYAYVHLRCWLPLVLPVLGALLMNICLVTWRVVFEQAEKRRVKSIFSRVVSPNIVNVLLGAEKLSLGGARCEVTVLFADVRGFTEFTDISQERAAAFITENKLSGEAAEAYINEQARETLSTVNTYLALVAEMVKRHDGTLDKYIGDCVMAFWGAPTPNANHARDCVRAAIDSQRALDVLNRERAEENRRREAENPARLAAGLAPRPMQPILLLGSGINTGMATVGLMGSEAHIINYTIFGREVNLASRLEGLSGRGRIFISEATHDRLLREDPDVAATCVIQPPVKIKGIGAAVKVYEVPWQPPGRAPAGQAHSSDTEHARSPDTDSVSKAAPGPKA